MNLPPRIVTVCRLATPVAWFVIHPAGMALLVLASLTGGCLLPVATTDVTFPSSGVAIRAQRFDPARGSPPPRPALLILHGADGAEKFADSYRTFAEILAGRGFSVWFVRYMDRTAHQGAVSLDDINRYRHVWTETVADAFRHVAAQPDVDPHRIGLVGFSLGAIASVSVASRPRLDVAAVVDFFGAAGPELRNRLTHFPPTLILHGVEDRIVPVEQAHRLADILSALGTPVEKVLYPGQGHPLEGAALRDAAFRALVFVETHVRDRPAPPAQ